MLPDICIDLCLEEQATELIPDIEATLIALTGTIDTCIDMLSPFGKLLVNQRHETEDVCDEDSTLEVLN
jgi:hypothetical protein